MLYAKYLIKCEFQEDGTLNTFKGSALRGAFGHALKKAVCTVHKKECTSCILSKQCLFARLFLEKENPTDKKLPSIPYPYVIEPPFDNKTFYKANEQFEFSLVLFGNIWELLPFLVYAFEIMGTKGIGRSNDGINQNASFIIKDVIACHDNLNQSIYNVEKQKLLSSPKPEDLSYISNSIFIPSPQKVELILHTPLRFKAKNQFSANLDFAQLYKLMLRRVSTTFRAYGEQEIDIDFHVLLEMAQQIKIIDFQIKWEEQVRYSSRQHTKLKIGGLIGSIMYEGNIIPFLSLLDLATLLHLGKQTSFGLGKVSYILKGN